jgi:hypothetical protein
MTDRFPHDQSNPSLQTLLFFFLLKYKHYFYHAEKCYQQNLSLAKKEEKSEG